MKLQADTTGQDAVPASWLAVGALGAGAFALVTTEFLPVGLLPRIAVELGVSPGQAGLSVTVPGIVAAFAAPASIALAGNVDRRRVLQALLALLAASNVISALATELWQLLAGRLLLGLAVGGFWTVAGALGPRLRPGLQGVRASALILSGVSLGTLAGVPAGTLLGELAGWRWAFGAAALVSVGTLAALGVLVPPLPVSATSGNALARLASGIGAVLSGRSARSGLLAALLVFVGQFGAYTYITPFLAGSAHFGAHWIGLLLLTYGVAGFSGNLLGGAVASSWAHRPQRAPLLAASLLSGAVFLLPLAAGSALAVVLLAILWGVGAGMLPIALQTWLFSTAPGRVETIQAVFVSVSQAAIGLGALSGGLLVDHAGIDIALLGGGLTALIGALVVALAGTGCCPEPNGACPDL